MDFEAERAALGRQRAMTGARGLLAAVEGAGPGGAVVEVRAGDIAALRDELEAIAGGTGNGGGIRLPGDVEHYDISATVRWRSPYGGCPDGEWVLDLHGSIGDTCFSSAHPQPAALRPEDVPGLPCLYEALDAGAPEPGSGWTVRDPAYLAGLAKGLGIAAGMASRRGEADLSAEIEGIVPDVPARWDGNDGLHPRHPEFDTDDVLVAVEAFKRVNPARRMRDGTVAAMLEAVFARRVPVVEDLLDAKARTMAALLRATRSAANRAEAFTTLREALRRCLPLVSLVTVRQALDGGGKALEASGLNPWCLNEGLATGGERIGTWWAEAALETADASAGCEVVAPRENDA